MPTLKWTQPATDDLWSIDDWRTETPPVKSPWPHLRRSIAARFLENFPRGGRPTGGGNRILRVINSPHLIIYRIIGEKVEILRIRHESEDWQIEA